MGAAEAADRDVPRRAGYRRPAGMPRGEARRRELLDRVVDDLAVNGLTSGNTTGVEAGFEALARALDREEAALVGFHNRVMVFDLRRRGGPPTVMPPAGTH